MLYSSKLFTQLMRTKFQKQTSYKCNLALLKQFVIRERVHINIT